MFIYFSGALLFGILLILAIIDFRTFRLPDVLTLPLILLGLCFAAFQNLLVDATIGAALGYIGFVSLEVFYKKVRGIDGLGRGDAKLLAAGGAWCGWYGLAFIILIASGSGLMHALLQSRSEKGQSLAIPFGPHLALGIFLTWVAVFIIS